MGMTTPLDHALQLATHGWLIVPVLGKVPCGNEWHRHATADPAALTKLFGASHHDGLGVQLGQRSGIVDFDADSDEAEATFQRLFGGDGPLTPTFQSARGRHRFFRWSDRLPQPDKIKFVIDGLEVRTGSGDKGAQTVLPPSGDRRWIVPPDVCDLAEIPADVIARINARWAETHKPKTPKAAKPIHIGAVPLNGDSESLDVPRWLRKHGREIIARTEGSDGVTRWHIECPGIDRHTTSNSVRDCCISQGPSGVLGGCCFHASCGFEDWPSLRAAIGELEYSDFHADESTLPSVDLSGITDQGPRVLAEALPPRVEKLEPFPIECMTPGGTLERIINQNLSSAMYPIPELALAGALALMSVITGRKICDRRNLRTNCYIMGLAPAGSGKNWARTINIEILVALGAGDMISGSKLKSGSGLVNAVVASPACLFQLDEISSLLQSLKNPKESSHIRDIADVLLEAYSSSHIPWKAGVYADATKNPMIDQPHLVVYGTAVPMYFWDSLTIQNMTDGLLGRMMVFNFAGKKTYIDQDLKPLSETMLSEVKAWLDYEPPGGGNLKSRSPTPTVIQHTAEAWARYSGHARAIDAGKPGELPTAQGLWGRTAEKTGKLALLSACSRCPPIGSAIPVVELQDVNWAIRLSNWLTRSMLDRSGLYVSENAHHANEQRILRLLDDWTPKELIGQRIRMKSRDRNELIRDMIVDGLILQRTVETTGAPRTEWRRA